MCKCPTRIRIDAHPLLISLGWLIGGVVLLLMAL